MAEWSRDTPWRQGHLLSDDAIDALGLRDPRAAGQVVVVASHDCDLAQDPEAEPSVELVVGKVATDKDGNCTHAKNARKLCVEFSGAAACWCEFEATRKVSLEKLKLNGFIPRTDALLSPENSAVFQMWLASRYRRSAFPDEFERRLTSREFKLHEKIAKAVKPHGDLIVGVFFEVDEGLELIRNGPGDTYTLDIMILHRAEPDFDAAEHAARSVAEAISKAFHDKFLVPTKTWQYIELRFCDAVSESVLTYQQFRQMKRWRLDHISLAAEPPHEAIAE